MRAAVPILLTLLVVASCNFLPMKEPSVPMPEIDSGYDGVIDVSNWQGSNLNFSAAKSQGGILAVIGKATQGVSYQSGTYENQRDGALDAGMLWGAYHFGTNDDPIDQANFFLSVVNPDSSTLLALDFESNGGASMSLSQAVTFVEVVQSKTGRWPVLYGGGYLKGLLGGQGNSILSRCPLWLADYNSYPTLPPGWDRYTLWQYTDGSAGMGPHSTPGLGLVDKEIFNGSASGLRNFWVGGDIEDEVSDNISVQGRGREMLPTK